MGSWGTGPLENDTALDYASDAAAQLVSTIGELAANPDERRFDRAFAALKLLELFVKHTPVGPPLPAEIAAWKTTFARVDKSQRKALDKLLDTLAEQALEFHRGTPGAPSSALARRLERIGQAREGRAFTLDHEALVAWVAPYGEDVAKAWAECQSGQQMMAIAQALKVPAAKLRPIVAEAVRRVFERLPMGAPTAWVAETLENWAAECIDSKQNERLPHAALARAAAHVARSEQPSDEDHLGLALKDLADAAMLEASVAATKSGMPWASAMTTADGPAWTAHREKDAEVATLLRVRLAATELKL